MILLYHNIIESSSSRSNHAQGLPLNSFKEQIKWLRAHRQIVPLPEYLNRTNYGTTPAENLVAITFDDGLANTFSLAVSLLEDWKVPATLFVSTSHLDGDDLLWFSYLNGLCFNRDYEQIEVAGRTLPLSTTVQRQQTRRVLGEMARTAGNPKTLTVELSSRYPLPEASLREYAGMSSRQLAELGSSKFLECGAHTVNHPFLDQLSPDEQQKEILQSKEILTKRTGRPVRYFAYPGGDYNRNTLEVLQSSGFEAAFATHQRRVDVNDRFEIVRIGIYSSSFFKFWLKAQKLVKPDLAARIRSKWAQRKPEKALSLNER